MNYYHYICGMQFKKGDAIILREIGSIQLGRTRGDRDWETNIMIIIHKL